MDVPPVATAGERRRLPRQRALLSATLTFEDGASMLDVMVRDLSPEGARLFVLAQTALPESFVVSIPEHGTARRALLCWRRLDHVGVRFVGEAQTIAPDR